MAYEEEAQRWNSPLIGSVWLPGVCVVNIDSAGRDVDQQKQKGTNKAYAEDSGKRLATGTIVVQLPGINSLEYLEFEDAMAVLDPTSPTASTGPLEIVHPHTEQRGITAIRIQDISARAPNARDGYVVRIKWIEHADKPKTVKKAPKKKAAPARAPGDQQPLIQPLGETATVGLSGLEAFDAAMENYDYEPAPYD